MSTPKKPRSDSALKTLPRERQSVIAEYLRDHKLDDARAWLAADGFKTSRTALSEFLSWYSLREQMERNESTVETLLEDLKSANPDWSPDQVQQAGQSFFTALALQQQDPKQWLMAQSLAIKREQLSLDARKIVLMEKKAAAFDQVKQAVNSGGLTPETLTKIERELKLL
jgi:hypothetical protein